VFTLLHVSDLHRSKSDPISNSELISALIADSQRFSRETPVIASPDAIVVSGDLVQGVRLGASDYPAALAAQYEEALELLVMMADRFVGGDRSKVVIIQGNHDVDWNIARRSMTPVDARGKDIAGLLQAVGSSFRWCWESRQLFEVTDPALYARRFDFFCALYERFYQPARLVFDLDPRRAWNLHSLQDGRVVVGAFNSCTNNDCFSPYGEIPPDAISESHLALLSARSNPTLRIAVWHHDVQGPPRRSDYMDAHTVRLMIDKGYRLGLHGHQHKSEAVPHTLYTSERETMAVLSAGSLCAGHSEIPPGFRRQYNVVEIRENCTARVHVRESQLPGIFSQGTLPGLGNPSYVDVEWSPVPTASLVNPGRGGGAVVSLLEEIERLLGSGKFSQAIRLIDGAGEALGKSARLLKTEALFRGSDWASLADHLRAPENADELAKCVRALIELKHYEAGEGVLVTAEASGQFEASLIRALREQIRMEKVISK